MFSFHHALPKVIGRISVRIDNKRLGERRLRFFNTLTQRAYALMYGTETIGSDISTTRLSNVFRYLTLGDGTGTIGYTSTALSSPRVPRAVNTQLSVLDKDLNGTPCRVFQLSYQFPEGGYTGTLSEIGTLDNLSPYLLTAGSRLRDENNAPTSVEVLSDDVLTVNYELFFPVEDFEQSEDFETDTIDINGQTTNVTFTRPPLLNWATSETACIIKPWWQGRPEDVADGYLSPRVNTVEVPVNQCEVTTGAGMDLSQGHAEYTTSVVIFASFTSPTLSSIEVFPCPQYASARGTCPRMLTVSFDPEVTRPPGEQIVLNTALKMAWPTGSQPA